MPPDDIFDISLAEGTQLDADITALNALNSAANPTTVLALLDELEAKDKRIAELEAKLETADKLQDSSFRHVHAAMVVVIRVCFQKASANSLVKTLSKYRRRHD